MPEAEGYIYNGGKLQNCEVYANTWVSGSGMGGGGVFLYGLTGSDSYVLDCTISNNTGQGLYIRQCRDTVVSNCTMINNKGMGLYLYSTATTLSWLFDKCRIIGNDGGSYGGMRVQTGAGVYNGVIQNSQLINNVSRGLTMSAGTMRNCLISSNYGGGISVSPLSLYSTALIDCTIVSNVVGGTGNSGGLHFGGGILRNCLIAYNSTYRGAGFTMNVVTTLAGRVENCTIVANQANQNGFGGGVYNYSTVTTGLVVNTICYSNFAGTTHDNWNDSTGANLEFADSCTWPAPVLSSGIIVTNEPNYVDCAAGNFRLAPLSPCINKGGYIDWMTGARDMDGHSRIDRFSGIVDMGCYEHVPNGILFGTR